MCVLLSILAWATPYLAGGIIIHVFEKMISKKLELIIDKQVTGFQAGTRKDRKTIDLILTSKSKL